MKRFVVISDFGDKEITSESGSATYMLNIINKLVIY
jgi:hypothetical protein